ncbi:hypothetical protein [Lewinella sp. LCG006]|uniref:hypothetical protein n=1 Tax=Lewinella sp. LCG006 TaxID=3231911 RepID=UPI003460F885
MSNQEGNSGKKKESLYEQGGVLRLEFSMAASNTPANITHLQQLVPMINLSGMDDLSQLPLPLLRGQNIAMIKRFLEKRREREADLLQFLFQAAIDRALEAINSNIEYWQEQMELILVEIAEQQQLLETLLVYDSALHDSISEYQQSGQISREANGALVNEDADLALVSYLQENDLPEYYSSSDALLYELMLEARAHKESQTQDAERKIGQLTQNYDRYKLNIEESLAIREELESDDPVRQQAAMLAYYELEKDVQLEIETDLGKSIIGNNNYRRHLLSEEENLFTEREIREIDILSDLEPFPESKQTALNTTPKL